jgi:hypothetical protein
MLLPNYKLIPSEAQANKIPAFGGRKWDQKRNYQTHLVFRSNQMIQPLRVRPRQSAVSRWVVVNHVFDPEH